MANAPNPILGWSYSAHPKTLPSNGQTPTLKPLALLHLPIVLLDSLTLQTCCCIAVRFDAFWPFQEQSCQMLHFAIQV